MADIATVAEIGTAAGTLVLAVATFAAVRSSNQSARVAERSLLAGLRPLLMPSRPQDPPERVGFADGVVMDVPPGEAVLRHENGAMLMAAALRNVGSGLALLQGWNMSVGRVFEDDHAPLDSFRSYTRDIYVPAGDNGFWQGAIRDSSDPDHGTLRAAVAAGEHFTLEVLYSDQEQARRFITRFGVSPGDGESWIVSAGRIFSLDE